MTKIIKLLANLSIEESTAFDRFSTFKPLLGQFLTLLCGAVDRRSLEHNEEFILNAVSCITNILYYDTASQPLLIDPVRATVF